MLSIKENIYVGCDPSWKEFSISIINSNTKTISLISKEFEFNSKQPYRVSEFSFPISKYMNELIEKSSTSGSSNIKVGIEYHSTYGAFMQGELLVLDNILINRLNELSKSHNVECNIYYQTYLSFVTGHKSSDKLATSVLVEDLLKIFEKHNYKIDWDNVVVTKSKKKGNHITGGEADSFIYSLRQFIKYIDELCEEDKLICKEVLELLPKFSEDKEKYTRFI